MKSSTHSVFVTANNLYGNTITNTSRLSYDKSKLDERPNVFSSTA